jgi:hypothetical protein
VLQDAAEKPPPALLLMIDGFKHLQITTRLVVALKLSSSTAWFTTLEQP